MFITHTHTFIHPVSLTRSLTLHSIVVGWGQAEHHQRPRLQSEKDTIPLSSQLRSLSGHACSHSHSLAHFTTQEALSSGGDSVQSITNAPRRRQSKPATRHSTVQQLADDPELQRCGREGEEKREI